MWGEDWEGKWDGGEEQRELGETGINLKQFHSDLSLVEVADDFIVDPFFKIMMQ